MHEKAIQLVANITARLNCIANRQFRLSISVSCSFAMRMLMKHSQHIRYTGKKVRHRTMIGIYRMKGDKHGQTAIAMEISTI